MIIADPLKKNDEISVNLSIRVQSKKEFVYEDVIKMPQGNFAGASVTIEF